MQQVFGRGKINNEIELCEIRDKECKKEVERALLQNRISYYIRWVNPNLFHRNKNTCIICVNDNSAIAAQEVIQMLCEENGYRVRFLMRKARHNFL